MGEGGPRLIESTGARSARSPSPDPLPGGERELRTMQLWVGLGNPGTQYALHRHNVGFMVVDALQHAHGFDPWKKSSRSPTTTSTPSIRRTQSSTRPSNSTYRESETTSWGTWSRRATSRIRGANMVGRLKNNLLTRMAQKRGTYIQPPTHAQPLETWQVYSATYPRPTIRNVASIFSHLPTPDH